MVNSRSLNDLNPKVAALCSEFINRCKEKGIDVIITSTYRDAATQNALYAIGRTVMGAKPTAKQPMGRKVTNAKAGQSYHNWKCAFDFVPIVDGKAVWDNDQLWDQCGSIAKGLGLEWAGDWTGNMREFPHCQYTGGLTLADFQAGKTL